MKYKWAVIKTMLCVNKCKYISMGYNQESRVGLERWCSG